MYLPQRLVIERAVGDSPLVKRILATSPGIPVDWVERVQEYADGENGSFLEIVKFRGRFIKPCPGTRFYNCCGYQILNLGIQCSLGCTYCILQAYFTSPNVRLFANLDDAIQQ